ncbi:plexin-A4-like isoform X2 [Apostichopus japonicus]|uniref:plexin-A4-like isoform X2 n=1 Tax=Stichopus japonicus TaxID=307972 RepID=UPI003AB7FE74
MKGFPFRGPELLSLFITFILLTKADCEPHVNDADHYLVEAFRSHQNYNRTLTLLKVHADKVYVAGNTALFYLSEDLELDQSQLSYGEENIYKILETSASQEKIFTCGSAGDGGCESRPLDDIDHVSSVEDVEAVVSPYTTVGVIAPGRERESESLYIARGVKKSPAKAPIIEIELQTLQRNRATSIISSSAVDSFLIHYSGTFFYNGFVYFLSSRRKNANDEESWIIPKLTRLCMKDQTDALYSFTEVELACEGKDNTVYSIAQASYLLGDKLFIVFTENIDPEYELNPGTQSALCVYDMGRLEETFSAAVKACACDYKNASHSNYLQFSNCFTGNREFCQRQEVVDKLTCGIDSGIFKYPEQHKDDKVIEYAILEQGNATFSSVVVAQLPSDRNHTIAFIGTDQGTLLKANLNGADSIVYEVVDVSAPVLADTTLVDGNETLLVLTNETVLKMSVIDCSQFSTCEECIRPDTLFGDPSCGWCTLKKSCTRYLDCASNEVPGRWLPYDEETCAAITSVTPPSLAIEEDEQIINLTVTHLPALAEGQSYECRFNENRIPATVNESTLECRSPTRDQLPEVVAGDSVTVKLHIYSSETDMNFLTTDYRFYSCGAIKSCSKCVNNEWECDWCKFEHRCTHNSKSCTNDKIIYGAYNSQNASTAADSCPQIMPQDTKLIPTEVPQTLSFQAKNLPPLDGPNGRVTRYSCQLKTMNPPDIEVGYMADATLKTHDNITFNVTCEEQEYTYSKDMQYLNTSLTLKWNTGNMVDLSQPVRLYKCSSMRPDCSRCLSTETTPAELSCVWCSSSNKCEAAAKCTNRREPGQSCPAPKIDTVEPKTSPLGGGTRVTLTGSNLGRNITDIKSITLVDVPCTLIEDTFKVGESIACEAGESPEEKGGSAVIVVAEKDVQSADEQRDELLNSFNYKDPTTSNFEPKRGPFSGGTTVKITGKKLDVGTEVEVNMGRVPCKFVNRTADYIYCETEDAKQEEVDADALELGVTVTFEGSTDKTVPGKFSFELDPEVTAIEPLKAIRAGGIQLTVTGERFDLIQSPWIIAKRDEDIISEMLCSPNASDPAKKMTCPSPTIPKEGSRKRRQADGDSIQDVVIGFILDGVTSQENWTRDNGFVFEFFPDPNYEPFKDSELKFKHGMDTPLEILGSNIDTATNPEEIKVFVGPKECVIQLIAERVIHCTPPENQPAAEFYNGSKTDRGLPYVTVKHGTILVFDIGYVRYVTDPALYIIICICGLLILIVCIALIIIYCLRKSKNKEVERLIMELTNVRTNISEELRELFAMLQTAMDKFETNPEGLPVLPLTDRSEYVKNMLFLNLNEQPTTEQPMVSETVDAMKKFSELISNKSFLLVFIRTLDKEKNLPMMDRVNIASLITLALLLEGKLDYLTDVMMTLMSEEIEDIVEKGRPRQLFRRNESIVEKLVSNWVAICLYDYLETAGAEKIVQLYGAIQCVIEKGPIDAVSRKSQFSLSDEHMLDAHIQFDEVNLQVVANEEDGEIASVTVLNVDTITQVKNKILDHLNRGRPYSARPIASDMDLEWRQGVSGQLVLRDEGADSEVKDGWKKINTLKDYRVGDDCRVALIRKQAHPNAQLANRSDIVARGGTVADMSEISETSFLQRCFCTCCIETKGGIQEANDIAEKVPLHRSPTLVEATIEEGVNLWHLIKETEGSDDIQHKSKNKRRLQKKGIKEVLLPLLPATRNALQKYVDGAFRVMLSDEESQVPKCIKYLFDFFDRQATKNSVDGPEVVNAWKNNVLPLRFWTTIMANPTYIFDVRRSSYVEACLRVLVQVLRDACSKSDFKLNKDSSPSRLLYASLLPTYTAQVEKYYKRIQDIPRLKPDDIKEEFARICKPFENIFDRDSTMFQLYKFANKFNESLNAALEEDDDCQNANLVYRMEQVGITLNE